mmetsp:Transcript_6979/g.17296  ORF Transcript_6979/g.17296 Transcript_6979/m.17296 type:complete len:202 (-) Transcript_6979:670-1275(-)
MRIPRVQRMRITASNAVCRVSALRSSLSNRGPSDAASKPGYVCSVPAVMRGRSANDATSTYALGKRNMSTEICARLNSTAVSLYHFVPGLSSLISSGVPMIPTFSRGTRAPSPSVGRTLWKTHIFPPMCLLTVKAALSAGPRHACSAVVPSNMVGKFSRKTSTTSLDSCRFTRRSSGAGTKSSTRSATTSIWGLDSPLLRL